jgi:phenylacetate-CoA ligase
MKGRSDDSVKVRGVLFYPATVEAVIAKFPDLGSEYLIEIDKKGNMDTCKVTLEYIEAKTGDLATLRGQVSEALWGKLNFKSDVELVPFGDLGKKLGVETRVKSAKKRVLDYRFSS